MLAIVLLMFGAKRIPDLARSLGSGAREFREGSSGEGYERQEEEDLPAAAEACGEVDERGVRGEQEL